MERWCRVRLIQMITNAFIVIIIQQLMLTHISPVHTPLGMKTTNWSRTEDAQRFKREIHKQTLSGSNNKPHVMILIVS